MIKEKHEKGPDASSTAVKDEPASADAVLNKTIENAETRIKVEDESATSSCSAGINKECGRALTKNGANNVIGSTNTGSLHSLVDRKEPHLLDAAPDEASSMQEDAGLMGLKSEEGLEPGKMPPDTLANMGMGGGAGVTGGSAPSAHPPPPDGVQPLASNVINKQSGSMEVQYMQQQSQIFVFSTLLANKGADAVLQGHFPSIIAYHCAQPGTKKYLEKNPLKVTQFNRQNPAQWLNNLAMMKNKGCTRGPGLMGKGPPNMDGFLTGDGLDDMVGLSDADLPWADQKGGLVDGISNGGGPLLPNDVEPPCLLRSSPTGAVPVPVPVPSMSLGHSPVMTSVSSASPSLGNMQPSLQGVKVPDENLTPQQRQHREEQLATIRKMQQMLFPEHQSMSGIPADSPVVSESQEMGGAGGAPMTGPPVSSGSSAVGGAGSTAPADSGAGPADLCTEAGGVPPAVSMAGGMGPGMGPGMMAQRPINVMGGPSTAPNPNISPITAQLEWQKLQHQFFEERKVRGPSDMMPGRGSAASMMQRGGPGPGPIPGPNPGSCPSAGVGAGPRLQGPPPPYHQTPRSASVPIALQSPSPASPNNPTSNLSLPSPRASSALNSPADPGRTFTLNRHLSTGQSPTSQDSPSTSRGLVASNPGTPMSSHLSPNSNLMQNPAQDFPNSAGPTPTTSGHQPADGMFGRTLQSLAQQKQQTLSTSTGPVSAPVNKEPNLMPVPSPQQIQYLNTFEGQELTIQKQPNTSLKDGNIISPSMISTSIDNSFANVNSNPDMTARLSGPNTPMTPSSMDMGPRFPNTPTVTSDGCRFQISSPQTSNNGNTAVSVSDKGQRMVGTSCLSPQGSRTPGGSADIHKTDIGPQFPQSSPHGMLDVHRFSGSGPGSGGNVCPTSSPGPFPPQGQQPLQSQPQQQQAPPKMSGFMNISPSGKGPGPGLELPVSGNYGCVRADNVPLNPNSTTGISGNPKVSHFDPISSLAQMSQQLTNSVASSLNGQPGQPSGMMSFGSPAMHMMDMGGCHGLAELDAGPGGACTMLGMPMQTSGHGLGHPHPHPHPHAHPHGHPHAHAHAHPHPHAHAHPHAGYHPGSSANSPLGPVRSLSPKITSGGPAGPGPFPGTMSIPRMMSRGPGCNPYNGANVQVKPNAPNTIQYLPAKPQIGNTNPRGPPSLDFLHRFTNPLSNLDSKMPTQNLQYFPGCGPNPGPMGHMDGAAMGGPDGGPPSMGGMMNGPPMGNGTLNNGPMMGGGMVGPGGMMSGGVGGGVAVMRGPGGLRPMGMIRMQQMGFNGPGGPGPAPEQMFAGPGGMQGAGGGAQMFVAGPKSSPMGMGAPDASQPLPPSMGQANSFKGSPFVGPTTADPNYAQQFHNFQQQLYATTTRSQMSSQAMGPGPGPPHSVNQPYFVPK